VNNSLHNVQDPVLLRNIREALNVTEECFAVLLGIAEKLSPGIYTTLSGDPGSIEQKFVSKHKFSVSESLNYCTVRC